ncbi:MAG: hypothetical protein KAW09_05505 [Thermoplasmata archaeon]|nr:hypothetical protein [Thermoplasmata archaeon]
MEKQPMFGIREKIALLLLVSVGAMLGAIFVLESQVRSSLLGTVLPLSIYHGYMIGLVFPEAAFIKIIWNSKSARAHNPFTGEFITTGLFVLMGAAIAVAGFLTINTYVIPVLESSFSGLVLGSFWSMIVYGVWIFLSIPLLAVVFFAIASPAGLRNALRSMNGRIPLI